MQSLAASRVLRSFPCVTLILFSTWLDAKEPEKKPASKDVRSGHTKALMNNIFQPVTEMLAISAQDAAFRDPKKKARFGAEAAKLAKNADDLILHAKNERPELKHLSASLARDAKDVSYWFNKGKYDEARFLLHNLTENCMGCHSARESKDDYPGAAAFLNKIDMKALPLLEQAQLLVATRQFDDAVKKYEEYFADSDLTGPQLALSDAVGDYLKITIRVQHDLARPQKTFAQWLKRKDLPEVFRGQVKTWQKNLQNFEKSNVFKEDGLSKAEQIVKPDQKSTTFDRSATIDYIVASALLTSAIDGHKLNQEQLARAYLMLGMCESVIGRSFWVSQTDYYLETAIRLAPQTPTAKKAFAIYDEFMTLEFSGSSGTHMPKEQKKLLEDLRKEAGVNPTK